MIKSLSSPLNSTPVGPPPTTTQCRSLLFSSSEIPESAPKTQVRFTSHHMVDSQAQNLIEIAYQGHLTASGSEATSYEFPGHGGLHEEKLHGLLHHGFQKLKPLLLRQLPTCHMII